METINAIGLVCPIPVIKAKKALASLSEGSSGIMVLVDNEIACQNLSKMAQALGYSCEYSQREDHYEVSILTGETRIQERDSSSVLQDKAKTKLVIAIGKNTMGEGSEELGKMLMNNFIMTLRELDPLPTSVLFFNSGVLLVENDSECLNDLKQLEERGTEILACGACTNFYGINDKVRFGTISNMLQITSTMAEADRIINI